MESQAYVGYISPQAPPIPASSYPAGMGAAAAAGPPQQIEQLFAVTVPGRPLALSWSIISPTRAVLTEPIVLATSVPDLVVSLMPGSSFLMAEQAAMVYWSTDGTSWSLLGAVWHQRPSQIFRTGWGALGLPPESSVQLAVSIEPMEVATNLGLGASGEAVEDRKTFAAAIARNLWAFLTSFAQGVQNNGEMMLVPTTVLDRWLVRFNEKFSIDPNFMLKS
mmetsp:Transcript_35710/g.72779  ORF Transcript_35710/g.72779 Transcript_35710/m.72779 type:complete len:221 (-) Transcript_35710:202-864(-)